MSDTVTRSAGPVGTASRSATRSGRRRAGALAVLGVALAAALTGCGSEEPAEEDGALLETGVTLLPVDVPLRAAVWAPAEKAILALQEDRSQVVKVETEVAGPDAEPPPTTVSQIAGLEVPAGENLAPERARMPGMVYVPIPSRDEVQVIETDDLLDVRTFRAGESPVRVAFDEDPRTVFALSEGGGMVTAVNLDTYDVIGQVETGVDGATLLGATRGSDGREFWIAGPQGVAYFPDLDPEGRAGTTEIGAAALVPNPTEPQRAYVAESGTSRVVALEPGAGNRLEVVAEAELDSEAAYLDVEEDALYAATASELVVLDPVSLEVRETVEFAPNLEQEEALEGAALSGLAVGEDFVYITLESEPQILLVEKPR